MLRAISCIHIEGRALRRKDFFKVLRMCAHSNTKVEPTVLSQDAGHAEQKSNREHPRAASASVPGPAPRADGSSPPPPPPPPPPPRSRRALTLITALTFTASLGGVYLYRKMAQEDEVMENKAGGSEESKKEEEEQPYPASEADFPERVQYLLVGGGTASFAAMRAIRSARPDASVLIVSAERALPYMRPPLSKELWREPELARRAADPDALSFRQWNGRRRSLAYEPAAFYAPVERLRDGAGAAVARGWRVLRLDVARREAELAAGERRARVAYEQCLVAPGVRARRLPALRAAAAAGRALAVRDVRDVARLARALDQPAVRTVAVVGAGLLGAELSAALADRLRERGVRVVALYREAAPLAALLPPYLAAHAARTLAALGVTLLPHSEVVGCSVGEAGVRLQLREAGGAGGAGGEGGTGGEREQDAQLVVECVGAEPDERLARASRLETHPELGGVLVNAELQARAGVWAAGDAACFHDELLGRRRVEHHDHAVASGRLAGENMAGLRQPRAYSHQSMFWSDLGANLGYEAIGIVDSSLETVGVFCEDAVSDASSAALAAGAAGAAGGAPSEGAEGAEGAALPDTRALLAASAGGAAAAGAAGAPGDEAGGKRYERGVVFYLRERRVVGVLLWNLFNRMHVARQVLAQGEFEDLFEVAKLFSLHEDD